MKKHDFSQVIPILIPNNAKFAIVLLNTSDNMCFSATASFGASTVLLTIGTLSIIKSENIPQRFLATIPLIFSVQQFAEGLVWISLTNRNYYYLHDVFMYVFLVFAEVVWPIFFPLSIVLLEKDPKRRKVLLGCLVIGTLTGVYLFFCLIFYKADAFIVNYHIRYDQNFPMADIKWGGLMYFIATILSTYVSSVKSMKIFGSVMLLSYIVTRVFYGYYFISVWCFFGAILSFLLLFIIIRINKTADSLSLIE